MTRIKEFKDGDTVYGAFLVAEANKCVSNKSKPYLNIVLQDATGTIPAKLWDVEESDYQLFQAGNLVDVQGEVLEYAGALQFKIIPGSGKQLATTGDDIDYSLYVPSAPVDKEVLKKKFYDYVDSIKNPEIKSLVNYLIKKHEKTFFEWPAAVKNHHNFVCGLLYHTVTMADMANYVCQIYPKLNRDILLGGILIHDIGKTSELTGPIATQYSVEGKLVGHISIACGEIREACEALNISSEMSAIMQHMILSHHGKNEYGSPVLPLIKEAVACSMIDDLDAKMNILEKALDATKPGESTTKLFNMDDRYFYKPTFED